MSERILIAYGLIALLVVGVISLSLHLQRQRRRRRRESHRIRL